MGSHTLPKSGLYIALAAVAVFFVMTAVASAQPSPTDVIYVGETGDYSSIQDAIDNASSGDTIIVQSDYDPSNDASGITIDKSITLMGEAPSVHIGPDNPSGYVIIDGEEIYYQIIITADDVTIKDLTIDFYMQDGEYTVSILINEGLSGVELNNLVIEPADEYEYPTAFIMPLSPVTVDDVTLQADLEPLEEGPMSEPSPLSPAPPGVTAVWVPSTVSGVTFSGFTISGTWDFGFYIEGSNNVFIGNSITLTDSITQNWAAAFYVLGASNTIGTSGSPNSIVLDTTSVVQATTGLVGVDVEASDNTVVQYNNIQIIGSVTYTWGILVWNSCGVSVASNTVFSTTSTISVGIQLVECSCAGSPVTVSDNTVYGHVDGIDVFYSSHVTVSSNNVHDNTVGVVVRGYDASTPSTNVVITDNNIWNNKHGVWVQYGNQVLISDNTFTDNWDRGILIEADSSQVTVGSGNSFTMTSPVSGSIAIKDYGTNNVIAGTSVSPILISNYERGIWLNGTSTTVSWVSISNVNYGVVANGTTTATISDVVVDGFNNAGIMIQNGSSDITIKDVEIKNGASGAIGIYVLSLTATIGVPAHGNLIHDIPGGYGIYIDSTSTGCYIDANTIYNVDIGINIDGNGNNVGTNEGNTIRDFTTAGIKIGGDSNTVVSNTIYNSAPGHTGIVVEGTGNTVGQSSAGNVLYNLDTGLSIGGTAAGNDIGYNDIGYTYGGITVGIFVGHGDDSNPNEIHDNMITVSNQGIQVTATSKNEIYGNTISCAVGILLDAAVNQLVHGNTINSATSYGIEIKGSSHDNEVYNNVINGGSWAVGIGIHDDAYSNKIYGNQITSVYVGIGLYDTDTASLTQDNEIYGNQITDASHAGIHLNGEAVQANVIYDNTIALSSLASVDYGILSEGDNVGNFIGFSGAGYDPNVIHGAFHYAIYVSNSVSFHVWNNDIDVTAYGAGSIGIYVTGSGYYGSIKNNNILAEVGIKIENIGSTTSSTTTYGNTIGTVSNQVSVGIEVTGSTNVILNADTIYATDKGVYVHGSSQSITVQGEIVSCEIGIEVDGSFVNVEGNTITANDIGIYYHDVDTSTLSSDLFITDNEISGLSATATNKIGIYVYNVQATSTSKLKINDNTISLSSFMADTTGIKIENSKLVETNTVAAINEIYNFDIGVLVTSSQYIDLQYLKIHDGDTGIKIVSSTNVRVMDNVELYSLGYGIYVTSGSSHVDLAGSSIGTTNLYIHDTSTGIYVGPGSLSYINIEQVLFEGTMNYGIIFEGFDGGSTTTQAVVSKCMFDSSDIQKGIEVLNSKFVKITDTSPFTGSIGTSTNPLPIGIAIEESTNVEINGVQIYADTGILVENAALPGSSQSILILHSFIEGDDYGIKVVRGNGVNVNLDNDITSTDYGIYVTDSDSFTMAGDPATPGNEINVFGCYYGLYVTGSTSNIYVSGSVFTDNQYGIFLDSGVSQVTIFDGDTFRYLSSHAPDMVGVHVHGASHVQIYDSDFVDLDYGILVDNGATNIQVYDNSFKNVSATWTTIGIEVTGNSQMSAYGNQFTDLDTGIYVINNVLAAYGIVIGDTSNLNEFDGIGDCAVKIESSQYVQITGNNFGSTTSDNVGVSIVSSSYIEVSSNDFAAIDSIAILMSGNTDNVDIHSNHIKSDDIGIKIDTLTSTPTSIKIRDMNSASEYIEAGNVGVDIISTVADSSYGIKIDNVKFVDIGNIGVDVYDSSYIEMSNLQFPTPTTPISDNAIEIHGSSYIKVHDSTFDSELTDHSTIAVSGSDYIYIDSNTFTGSSPAASHAMVFVSNTCSNIYITENTFMGGPTNPVYRAITVRDGVNNYYITDNIFATPIAQPILTGIYLENNANSGEISGNTFESGSVSDYNVYVSSVNTVTIGNNEFHSSSTYGVYVASSSDIDINSNSFDLHDYDIYVTNSHDIDIHGNTHSHSTGSGVKAIYIESSYNVDVYGGESFSSGIWSWVIQVWQSYTVTIKDSSFGDDLVTSGHVVIDIRRSHGVDVLNNAFGAQSGGGFIIRSYSGDPSYENYDVNIEGNTFSGGDIGIEISEYSYDHQVHGNRFTGAFDYGIMVDGILSTSTPGIQIYGNTFESGSIDLVAIKAWATGNVPVSIYGNTINLDEDGTHAIDVIDTGGSNAVQVYDNSISSGTMTNTIGVYVEGSSGTARLHAYSTGSTLFTGLTFAFYVTGSVGVDVTIENHQDGEITDNQYGLKVYQVSSGTVVFQNNYVDGLGAPSQGVLVSETDSPAQVKILNNNIDEVDVGVGVEGSDGSTTISGNTVDAVTYDVKVVNSSGVTITGNTLDATYGIYLDGASSVTISDNDIYNNNYGIYVKDSSSITIDDSTDANNVYNNGVGIYLTGTDNTITISGNNIYDNTYGIKFESATVSDVTISSNNLYFSTMPSTDSYLIWMDSTSSGSVTLTDNVLTDNSMPTSPSHSYGFYASSTSIVFTYTGGSVSYLFAGFYLTGTLASGSSISSVTVGVGNNYGIYLDGPVLDITGNTIQGNEYGAFITEFGVAADFSGNAFNSNEYGMYVLEDGATISGNSYSGNNYGIYLDGADNALVFGSTFSGDGQTASIYIDNSDSVIVGNSVSPNTFTNGLNDGIYATGSDSIQIIYNQFSTMTGTAINVTAGSSPYIGYNQGTGLNVGIHVWSVDVATIEYNSLSGSSTYGILVQGVSVATTSINNNIVHDFNYGICVTGSSNVNVAYNDVYDNGCGVCIRDSSYITIEWNTVHGNTDNFCFSGTLSDIVIRYNDIYGSTCGIHVSGVSGGIIIAMNKIHNNDYGVCIEASSDIQVIQNRPDVSGDWGIYDNNIAGVRIYGGSSNNKIWDNEIYSTAPISGASGVLIVEAINNNVSENKIYGFGEDAYGINIMAGSGNEVWNNEIYTVEYGIYVNGADTSVKNNHVHDGVGSVGVYLGPDADGTIVVYNTITAFTTGILADGDSTNLIETVTLAYNTINADRGIETEYVDSSSVSDNVISATSYGIILDHTTNVGIRDNEITGSSGSTTGISVSDGCDMITIANNRISGFHDGVFVELSTNVAIDGNEVYSCYTGISADLTGPAGSDIGIQISNNVVHDVTNEAIDVEEITSGTATVSGNHVTSAYYGIYIDSVSNIVIQGNTISNVDYGIYGMSYVATITNNNIQDVDEDAINLYNFDTLTIQGNEISNAYRGIYVSGVYDLTVMSNTISDVDDDGIYVSGVDDMAYVQDNTVNNVDDDAIYVEDADYVSIFGNSIEYVSNNGISVHDSYALIYSNHIEEYYNYGIELDGSDDSEIHDNTLINCYGYYAIYVLDSMDSYVYGNTITYSEGDGIHVDGSDGIEIYDNTIRDIYDTAIYVYDSDDALIHDNDIAPGSYYEQDYGIYVSSSDYVEVFGNSIVGGYWTGIRIYSSDDAVVHDNEVNDAYEGISAEYADNIRIDNNTITLGSDDDVGIEIDSSYGRIDNNEISGPLDADITGIETSDTDDVIYINDNTITATYGIDISYSTWDMYVYNNTITVSDTGIYVYVAWYLTINANAISGSSGSVGIYMQGIDWWNDVISTYVQNNSISGFEYGIKMVDYIDYSYVLDNEISDVTYGIVYFANETDGLFEDAINYNTVTASYYGIYINATGAVLETDVKYNNVDADIGIVVSGAKYVFVENNVVDASTMGIMVQSWFDGSTWYYANDNDVEYNVVNATGTGIYVFDAWYSDVNYNTVTATEGIIIEDIAHSDVEHNVVTASLGIASYYGYDNDIRYNEVYASGTDTGIAILNGDSEDVKYNSVDGFDYGIVVVESTEIDVVGNTVTNSTTAGIYVDSSTDTLISDNEVSGGLYGIYDTEAQTEDLITSNSVDGADTGIYAANPVGYVNITENAVTNASTGIYVINAANNLVSGNSVSYTVDGIVLETVDGTEVSDNTVSVSSLGIYAEDSHAITIEDNAVESEGDGIVTVVSQYNYIQDNDVTAAGYGIAVYSDESSWVQNNDIAAGIGILVDSSTYTEVKYNDVTESTYGIVVYDSSYVHVAVNDVIASYAGIYVYGVAEHQLIENNDVTSEAYGIYIDSAISTVVRENDVTGAMAGVYLFDDANTEVMDNDITGSVYGVQVEGGAFQYVGDNTIVSDYVGVELSMAYDVTVEGNTITAAYAGVHLADDTILTEVVANSITSMYYGVHVEGSGNNTVADNTIDATIGVEVEDSPYILVQNNTISGGFVYKGIEVVGSTYVEVYYNTVTQSTYGIYVKGEREARLSYIDIKGNDVSYASLYGIYVKYTDYVYLTDNSVSYSMYGIVVKRSTYVLVTGDSTFMNRIGHYVLFSSQVRLTQVYAENDDNGFFIERSTQVWVDNSTFYRDVFAGVVSDSNEFVIENNEVIECIYGIVIRGSQDAEVRGNTVSQTVYIGMWIDKSSAIEIHDNYVHDSYVTNLKVEESTGLTIEHNVFVNSTNNIVFIDVQSSELSYNQIEGAMEYGLKLLGSSGNQIFLNNFVNNNRLGYHEAQAFDDGENTYYTMVNEGGSYRYYGNYWSDHTSPDNNGDGIVDTPYAIEGGSNEDPYPLVAPISL